MKRTIAVAMLLFAASAFGHTVLPREVVAWLNAEETRERCGIARAGVMLERADLLLIEVNANWFRLGTNERQHLALEWRDLWRHAVASGRVSVIDVETRQPVIRYLPGGGVVVMQERNK